MMDDLRRGLKPGVILARRPELMLEKPTKSIGSAYAEKPKAEKKEVELETDLEKWLKQLEEHRVSAPEKLTPEIATPEKATEELEIREEKPDFESQIREAAYFLSLDNYSYNDLCWFLAEKLLKFALGMPSLEDIKKKAEIVFRSSCTYDELCWLNAEVDILAKKQFVEKKKIWEK